MVTGIFDNIARSIASDLPGMAQAEEQIVALKAQLDDYERDLRSRRESARILCRALIESGLPISSEYPEVHAFCREEARKRGENQPVDYISPGRTDRT